MQYRSALQWHYRLDLIMVFLIYVALLLAIGVFGLLALQMLNSRKEIARREEGGILAGPAKSTDRDPAVLGQAATQQLAALEATQERLRAHYPALSRMLSSYLHAEALSTEGGLEQAVGEMVIDWQAESAPVIDDISRLLAENPEEAAVRAILQSFCDANFEVEGYRAWLIWLQGQFNSLGS